jgi:hypothetical protein
MNKTWSRNIIIIIILIQYNFELFKKKSKQN